MSEPLSTPSLASAVREIEAHVAGQGWDQPSRIYALVETRRIAASDPELAEAMGLEETPAEDALTPVEQEPVGAEAVEEVLATIVWPETVDGCAVVVERLVLPPDVDPEIPDDPVEAAEFARQHPLRQEVRLVAGVTRDGATYCALRLRAHDDDQSVVDGTDLVPGLLDLLHSTFDEGVAP